jgi:hypothetical protein
MFADYNNFIQYQKQVRATVWFGLVWFGLV